MPAAPTFAVLGFRPHTYWTAVAALAGRPKSARVIERRRIVFANGDERFVYHQAAEADPARREAMIEGVRAATVANAAREIATLIADLQRDGVGVRFAATSAASVQRPATLDEVLAAHSRIHAAEGNFYRDVVASACEAVGLRARRVVERDLPGQVAALLGVPAPALAARLKTMGAELGPPWSEDYRLATQAAWTCLEDAAREPME
jgi:hypothetical protein